MSKLIIAIDPGVNGGIVFDFGDHIDAHRMPPTEFDTVEMLKAAKITSNTPVWELFIEEPPLFAGRAIPGSAIGKLQFNCGVIIGAAIALGFRVHRVRPAVWMKTHPVGTKGDLTTTQWKNKLKGRAAELFPQIDVTLAVADALLILDSAKRGAIN